MSDESALAQGPDANPCGPQLATIYRISAALYAKTDVEQLLSETLEAALQTTDAEGGSILLYDPQENHLVFRQVLGDVADYLRGKSVPLSSRGQCATVFKTGHSQIVEEGFDPNYDEVTGFHTRCTLTTPIRAFGEPPLGVIQMLNKRSGVFDKGDQELLTLVSVLAATVLENARRAEAEKETALAHAEAEKQASLTRILGFIGHQLKNQAMILDMARQSFGPLLLEEITRLKQQEAAGDSQVEQVYRELEGMLRAATGKVIRQAKVINEYGERKDLFEFRTGDLKALLEEELAQLVELARQHGDNVNLSGMQDIPMFPFEGFFVAQAVFNLVNNAFQAIREHNQGGQVWVRLAYQGEGTFPSGNYVEIEVEDNGSGMPEPVLQSILEGHSVSTKVDGSGVGLQLVRDVVLTHAGELTVESTPGIGSIFRIKLPFQRLPAEKGQSGPAYTNGASKP
jgi:signal transduction histidine kinase